MSKGYPVNAAIEWEEINMDHQHHHSNQGASEVKPEVSYSNGALVITLKDKMGTPLN